MVPFPGMVLPSWPPGSSLEADPSAAKNPSYAGKGPMEKICTFFWGLPLLGRTIETKTRPAKVPNHVTRLDTGPGRGQANEQRAAVFSKLIQYRQCGMLILLTDHRAGARRATRTRGQRGKKKRKSVCGRQDESERCVCMKQATLYATDGVLAIWMVRYVKCQPPTTWATQFTS